MTDMHELQNLWPLRKIAEELGVKSETMHRWAERRRRVGFPEVKRTMGRYNLYDIEEVREWLFLWKRINGNMGNDKLNQDGERLDG